MRFYSADEVHAALSLPALADSISEALKAGAVAPLRHAHALSQRDSLLLMPAWSAGERGAIGVKLVTVMPGSREGRSATVNALYVLFDRAIRSRDFEGAERSAVRRALLDPEDHRPWLDVAAAREKQGALTGALEALGRARSLDSQTAAAAEVQKERVRMRLN